MVAALEPPVSAEEIGEGPYYSVSEAAALLGVSRVTVWRWIKAGRLAPARLGHRTVRIPREDMLRLMRPGTTEVTPDVGIVVPNERGHFVVFYDAHRYLAKS